MHLIWFGQDKFWWFGIPVQRCFPENNVGMEFCLYFWISSNNSSFINFSKGFNSLSKIEKQNNENDGKRKRNAFCLWCHQPGIEPDSVRKCLFFKLTLISKQSIWMKEHQLYKTMKPNHLAEGFLMLESAARLLFFNFWNFITLYSVSQNPKCQFILFQYANALPAQRLVI